MNLIAKETQIINFRNYYIRQFIIQNLNPNQKVFILIQNKFYINLFILIAVNLISNIQMCICSPAFESSFQYFLQEVSPHVIHENFKKSKTARRKLNLLLEYGSYLSQGVSHIFVNGNIYTMDEKKPRVQAVAIRKDKIFKIGTKKEVMALMSEHTKIVDLKGKTMLPGFIDPHIHMCFCLLDHWLDLSFFANKDMEEIKSKIKEAIKDADPSVILAAQLFDPKITPGVFDVSRKGLDQFGDKIALFILEANGHVAHVNSAALKLAGIDKNTKDPPHGRLVRDKDGELTGEIQETAVGLFKAKFPKVSQEQYTQNFVNFLQTSSSKGCTSLHDCGIGYLNPKGDVAILFDVFNKDPPVRYSGFLVSTQYQVWKQIGIQPNNKNNDLRINGIKCWADGSTQGGSAYLRQNYTVEKWGKGHPNYTKQQLYEAVKTANDDGWQVGIHVNGDAGIDMALDAYQAVLKSNPKPELRHRLEHTTICHYEHLKRMKQLKITPSFLIGHIYYYGQVFQEILGQKRAELMDPMKSAFDLGLTPTMHSDYNCQPVDPLRCIHNAVTRRIKKTNKVINKKQCITPYQAVQAMTINAAWQCQMEDIVGSITEEKLADFVILMEDPMKVDPDKIHHIQVHSTWLNGNQKYVNKDIKEQNSNHHTIEINTNYFSLISYGYNVRITLKQ